MFKATDFKLKYSFNPNIIQMDVTENEVRLVFKTEPTSHVHFFVDGLKLENGKRPVPGLIWIVDIGRSNYVDIDMYAYIKYTGMDTVLYYPPFFNASKESICNGSTRFNIVLDEEVHTNDLIENIVTGYFRSNFSHATNHQQVKGNIHELMNEILNAEIYPNNRLLKTNKTLQDVIL